MSHVELWESCYLVLLTNDSLVYRLWCALSTENTMKTYCIFWGWSLYIHVHGLQRQTRELLRGEGGSLWVECVGPHMMPMWPWGLEQRKWIKRQKWGYLSWHTFDGSQVWFSLVGGTHGEHRSKNIMAKVTLPHGLIHEFEPCLASELLICWKRKSANEQLRFLILTCT